MKCAAFLSVLLFPLCLFAGQASLWSAPFTLSDHPIAVEKPAPGLFTDITLSAAPNPFMPLTTLRIDGLTLARNASLKVFDVRGKVVHDFSRQLKRGARRISFKASNLANGIYIVRLVSGNKVKHLKIALVK